MVALNSLLLSCYTYDNMSDLLSIVVPAYNEAAGLSKFHDQLTAVLDKLPHTFEILYCDDGSTDMSSNLVKGWNHTDKRVQLVRLSRNFGKEAALSAGISEAKGNAIIMIDADGQHPVGHIAEFIDKWQGGAQVVVGVRDANKNEGGFKRIGSRIFYKLFNKFSSQPLIPGSTDFRLIDAVVREAFMDLPETDRITRGLIDWLGFERAYVHFTANARMHGTATYNKRKLISLAANSFVSLTATPLYVFGYLGILITAASFVLGCAILLEQLILNDPLGWNFTGTAMLGVLILFLVGIVLLSQGMLSVYISHIHEQSKRRPLYVIDRKQTTTKQG